MSSLPIPKAASKSFRFAWIGASLAGGVVVVILLAVFFSFDFLDAVCAGLLSLFILLSGALAFQLVQWKPLLIWSPLPWFLLASAAYFGFGPLIYFFGNDDAKGFCELIWPVTRKDLFRVSWLNMSGTAVVVAVWWWRARNVFQLPFRPARLDSGSTANMALLFYGIGLPAKLVSLAFEYGLLGFTAPGVLNWIAHFSAAGLLLLTLTALRNGALWWWLWGVMLLFEITAAILTFSKIAIILSLVPCLLGYFLYRPVRVQSFLWSLILLATVYLISSPFIGYIREQDSQSNAVGDRYALAKSYLEAEQEAVLQRNPQNWWIRLNYANTQTFAMKEYDEGDPGQSLMVALIAPIPRVLWPGKPVLDAGKTFYQTLTGHEGASFGMGLFAEAYWNGGWLFVILCSIGLGWLFGSITLPIVEGLSSGNLWILPIALIWIRGGIRVDGWFYTDVAGPAVFTLLYILLMHFFRPKEMRRRKTLRRRRSRLVVKSSKSGAEVLPRT